MVRDITIHPVLNGFVCTVGCQQVVFRDTMALAQEIKNYYDDPKTTENRFLRDRVNDTLCAYPEPVNQTAPTPGVASPPCPPWPVPTAAPTAAGLR